MSEQQPSLWAELKALVRGGAKDLHNAVVPAFPESARAGDEMGTPLNPTPQIVTEDMKSYEAELAAAASLGRPEQERGMDR